MLAAHQIRPAPNKGRYLFHNPVLHVVIGSVDWLLGTVRKPSAKPLAVTPKKILLCCQAHIGDAIIATSVLPVIKAAFPDAQIGFLTHPSSIEVFTDNPRVTWVHTFSHWKLNRQNLSFWKKFLLYFQSRGRALNEIKAIGYDLAVDLYPYFPNSIPLLSSANIPLRLGWTSAGLGGLLSHALDWENGPAHVVDWHKRLLGQLIPCQPHLVLAKTELYTSDDIRAEWQKIASNFNILNGYITFHIGVGDIHRRWPTEHWKELAKLCVNAGLSIVLLGHGDEEIAICHEIAAVSPNTYDLSGKLSWRLMTEAIGQSQLLVGLESASGHIAAARNVRAINIYSGTTRTSVWKPFHSEARALVYPVACSPCYLPKGCVDMECIKLTTTDKVIAAIKELLF